MTTEWFQKNQNGFFLFVRITPHAAHNEIIGVVNKRLKIKICKPAHEYKANEELIRFLATHFHISMSCIKIIKGHTVREKTLLLTNISHEQLLLLVPPTTTSLF